MKTGVNGSIYLISVFFVIIIAIAFYHYRQFPALAVAGEESPGTWLSGVLLSVGAGITLMLVISRGWNPWSIVATFLFLLAVDEHFMLHERAKQWLIFNLEKPALLIREMPVLIGAALGSWIAWTVQNNLSRSARKLLMTAVIFGLISVTLDVIGAVAMWEEILKLLAELSLIFALLIEAGTNYNKAD
jgi:hypothetical protein